ncbi:hypothetical protein GCM10020295_37490 [Streptomyces cinereospinus]
MLTGLEELRTSGWRIGVATNGATDIQQAKLRATGIFDRVDAVCISEETGARKPGVAMFQEAVRRCGGAHDGVGMWVVGDDPVNDMAGAREAGFLTVWIDRGRSWPEELPPTRPSGTGCPCRDRSAGRDRSSRESRMSRAGITVGMLHPGRMGAAVADQLRRSGTTVLWSPHGRSHATAARAAAAALEPVDDLSVLLARADVVLSLCPPAAAEDVARQIADHGFAGKIFIEANAIAPQRVRRIAHMLPKVTVVDATVIGSPPVGGKRPKLYASGPSAALDRLAGLFATTDVQVCPLGEEIGKASSLKLAYTSYQKASRVLAAVAYGLADANGVADELLDIARQRTGSYLAETEYIPKTAARAWRWGPEMEEAAELLAEAGLPDDLMRATASVLSRWDRARDADLSISDALDQLRGDAAPAVSPER